MKKTKRTYTMSDKRIARDLSLVKWDEIERIKFLKKEGRSVFEISKIMGVSRQSIYERYKKIINVYDKFIEN